MSNDQKSVCRVVHNKNYTIINNTICKDNRISYKAKGIWLYAFSRPDDWNFYLCDIMNQSSDGKDSVSSGLSELENSGYLKRERTKDKKGRFSGWTYIFYETPREIQKISPKREKPDIGKTRTRENPLLLSTDSLPSTEKKQQQKVCDAAVVFYKCLEEVSLTEREKKGLMKYSEDEVKDAVAFATHRTTKIKTTLIRTIMWALKEKPEVPKIVDIKKNRKLAKEGSSLLQSKGWIFESKEIYALIESTNPYNPVSYSIPYDCENFKQKLDEILFKCKFKLIKRS